MKRRVGVLFEQNYRSCRIAGHAAEHDQLASVLVDLAFEPIASVHVTEQGVMAAHRFGPCRGVLSEPYAKIGPFLPQMVDEDISEPWSAVSNFRYGLQRRDDYSSFVSVAS
jgi:hypothetical protein